MAAHSVTILENVLEWMDRPTENKLERFEHALSYAPGMDELDLPHWRTLYLSVNVILDIMYDGEGEKAIRGPINTLREDVEHILGVQREKWEKLGQPSCHEDWVAEEEERKLYCVLFIYGDVEPMVHGPYICAEDRDNEAIRLRREEGPEHGIYRLDLIIGNFVEVEVEAYPGRFLEGACEASREES